MRTLLNPLAGLLLAVAAFAADVLATIMRLAFRALAPAAPRLARLIRFSQHPFVERGHAKALAGGRWGFPFGGILGFARQAATVALACALLLVTFQLATAAITGPAGLLLAFPALLTVAREKKAERMRLINENRALLDKAAEEKRDLTAEETTNYQARMERIDALRTEAERYERQAELEADAEQREREPHRPQPGEERGRARQGQHGQQGAGQGETREYRPESRLGEAHRRRFLLTESEEESRAGIERVRRFVTPPEQRGLQASNDPAGGFLVTPQQFVADLIQAVDDEVFVRRHAHIEDVPEAASLGAVSLDADPAEADWTSELATGSEDTQMAFGKRELTPHPLAKRIKVSNKLLRQASRAENIVRDRLAYRFGVAMEKGYLTGNGANQPLGVFTASAQGISTGRDVSAGNTTTAITFDGLKAAKWKMKSGYLRAARWLFHRDGMLQIDQIKDGNNNYIWQPSTQVGAPDMLLKLPIDVSEFAPNTFTTGKYVGLLADWRFYWIADALSMTIQRLIELYAEANQTGFIGRIETDGMPVLEEAFVRVKLA